MWVQALDHYLMYLNHLLLLRFIFFPLIKSGSKLIYTINTIGTEFKSLRFITFTNLDINERLEFVVVVKLREFTSCQTQAKIGTNYKVLTVSQSWMNEWISSTVPNGIMLVKILSESIWTTDMMRYLTFMTCSVKSKETGPSILVPCQIRMVPRASTVAIHKIDKTNQVIVLWTRWSSQWYHFLLCTASYNKFTWIKIKFKTKRVRSHQFCTLRCATIKHHGSLVQTSVNLLVKWRHVPVGFDHVRRGHLEINCDWTGLKSQVHTTETWPVWNSDSVKYLIW